MNAELTQRLEEIERKKAELASQEHDLRMQVLVEVRELIKKFQYTDAELRINSHRKAVQSPVFKSPYAEETWSGRGRKPSWFSKALSEGYTEDDLRIEK